MADNTQISFWEYLNKHTVTIPIIQRDYAQGRRGREFLRQNFLRSIKRALDNPPQPLILDFVYGCLQDNQVFPLDGQQRLTTLWLLHWFIAYKSGALTGSVANTLERFHYQTRISSDEFMHNLCKLKSPVPVPKKERPADANLMKYIKNQRWYRSDWDSDPTIKAMLTMIQGTAVRDRQGNDIVDGLVEVFADCGKEQFVHYWRVLTENRPILFYEYALGYENLPETDSLYVKMNARGKPLTDFENFKADLLNFLKSKSNCEDEDICKIGAWFDNGGSDLFWKHSNKEMNAFVIDEVFFAFLQRFFLKLIIDQEPKIKAEEISTQRSFKHLFGDNGNKNDAIYTDFSPYEDLGKDILSKETFGRLQRLTQSLLKVDNLNSLCTNPYEVDKHAFAIPQYRKNGSNVSISDITISGRIIFSAVIDFFESNKGSFDPHAFRDWIRFAWNIVNGTNTSGADNLIQVSRYLHNLASHSCAILSFLSNQDESSLEHNSDLSRQYLEEVIKAKRILLFRERDDSPSEQEIYDAERACFFKGSIRFLYTNAEGVDNWNDFQTKYRNALKLFDSEGVSPDYSKDSLLLCYFVSIQTKWMQIRQLAFGNKAETWRTILRRERYWSSIHSILMNLESIQHVSRNYESKFVELEQGYEEINRRVQCDLCNPELMNNIVGTMENGGRLHWKYGHYCVYPPNARADWKKYVLADNRNPILFELFKNGTIKQTDTNHRIGDSGYLWGWDIPFEYNGKKYCWDALDNLNYISEKRPQVKIMSQTVKEFLDLLDFQSNIRLS